MAAALEPGRRRSDMPEYRLAGDARRALEPVITAPVDLVFAGRFDDEAMGHAIVPGRPLLTHLVARRTHQLPVSLGANMRASVMPETSPVTDRRWVRSAGGKGHAIGVDRCTVAVLDQPP